jgi:MarR family transcriptional regulator, transcriptional regulator for hemolysin
MYRSGLKASASKGVRMSNRLELFELIGTLARRRFQAAERAFAPLGLNHTEGRLLTALERESGEATQDVLSSSLSVDRSNAGRALKRLEQRGYIARSRNETDTRTNLVQLTAAGAEVVVEVSRLRKELARDFFSDLSEAEAGAAVDLLGKTR